MGQRYWLGRAGLCWVGVEQRHRAEKYGVFRTWISLWPPHWMAPVLAILAQQISCSISPSWHPWTKWAYGSAMSLSFSLGEIENSEGVWPPSPVPINASVNAKCIASGDTTITLSTEANDYWMLSTTSDENFQMLYGRLSDAIVIYFIAKLKLSIWNVLKGPSTLIVN